MTQLRIPVTCLRWLAAGLTILSGIAPSAVAQQTAAPAAVQGLPDASLPKSATFRLTDVHLSGVTALDAAELDALVQPYRERQVSLDDLQALTGAITARYRAHGYFLARAIVPVQKVRDGIVEISVIEGRLGRIEVSIAPDAPISEQRVRAFLAPLVPGGAVNASVYERAMLLLSDQPGIRVTSGLQQGITPGTVDLAVEVVRSARWQATVDLDNHGTREVGRGRIGGTARLNSPAGVGDNLDVRLMVSDENLAFGRLGYELPLGGSGLRAGAGIGRIQYELGGDFGPLDAHGTADVADFSLNYPLIRQRRHNLFVRAVFESRRLTDEYRAVDLRLGKRTRSAGLGWAWERRDDWMRGGYFASNGTLYRGHLRIGDAAARAADQAPGGAHTAGDYSRFIVQVSRLQAIAPRHSVYWSVGGQWANKNLDASEKLALGGARAVRAYASSEALVDQGWIQTIEWRWALADAWTPYLFYDAAHGRQRKSLSALDAANGISLRGAGVGLSWGKPGAYSVNATLAWRSGTRPAQTDGGGRNPRFFIRAQKAF